MSAVADDAPTGSNKTVTTAEDTSPTQLKAADFGFADVDTDDALASVKITALPKHGQGTLELDGTAVTANGSVTKAQLDAVQPGLHAAGERERDGLRLVHLQGERRRRGERVGLHHDASAHVTAENDAPTGASKTVTLAEDGSHTFAAGDFGFTDTDSG